MHWNLNTHEFTVEQHTDSPIHSYCWGYWVYPVRYQNTSVSIPNQAPTSVLTSPTSVLVQFDQWVRSVHAMMPTSVFAHFGPHPLRSYNFIWTNSLARSQFQASVPLLLGLPGVRFLTGQSGFLGKCPVRSNFLSKPDNTMSGFLAE